VSRSPSRMVGEEERLEGQAESVGVEVGDRQLQLLVGRHRGQDGWQTLVEISASKYEEIVSALVALARLEPPFHAGLVERNYRDLQALCQFVTITLSLGGEFATPVR
jgi:hypothetical protein